MSDFLAPCWAPRWLGGVFVAEVGSRSAVGYLWGAAEGGLRRPFWWRFLGGAAGGVSCWRRRRRSARRGFLATLASVSLVYRRGCDAWFWRNIRNCRSVFICRAVADRGGEQCGRAGGGG